MRAFAALQRLLSGPAAAAAARESRSEALDVGSEVIHGHLGHGTIVRLYDDQSIASAEVLLDNGNVRSFAATSLTKVLPRRRLADRGMQREGQAESLPNPLNAAR